MFRALERETNRSLVNRGRGKQVSLTADGAAFLVQARRLLLLADEMRRPEIYTTSEKPLRLGTTLTFALSVVSRVLAANISNPIISNVIVKTARSHQIMSLLDEGQIDVALVLDQGPNTKRQSMIEVDLAWVDTQRFSKSCDTPLPLAFLDDARDLRRHAYDSLDSEYCDFKTSLITHPDPVGLRAFLNAGAAVSILPRPAIVEPLKDVGEQLGLPALKKVPVSLYSSQVTDTRGQNKLGEFLISELKSN
ncbi:MAG: LysR family transcriptional regulator [Pseudomonadota bacterium]